MARPIIDLHCDLLSYLCRCERRSAYDRAARCSIPQLRVGNVKAQVMAVFTETGEGSSQEGALQTKIFQQLPDLYPDSFELIQHAYQLEQPRKWNKTGIMLAYENASGFCDEKEDLELALKKLIQTQCDSGKIIYISMTWNGENRFGGGAESTAGLKPDGERLLDFLHNRRIAIDLSHASDPLAYGILRYIDAHQLNIPVMASHSNFRIVRAVKRNLPDEIAQEILRRRGVIGLNFYRHFVGEEGPHDMAKHLSHALKLGAGNNYGFGADFFYSEDFTLPHKPKEGPLFLPAFQDSSCYGQVMHLWKESLTVPEKQLDKIAYGNVQRFLKEQIF